MPNRGRTSSTVAGALRLLCLLAEHPEGMRLSELARRLDMGKSSVHLLLATLAEYGFVERAQDSSYRVGLTAFEVGTSVPDSARFGGPLAEPMRALADESGEAVSLALPRGRDAIIVQRFESARVLRAEIQRGTRMPMHSCASGKFLLARLPDEAVDRLYPDEPLPDVTRYSVRTKRELRAQFPAIRANGYAENHDEYTEGIVGVATGVRDASGTYVAALSIAGPTNRFRCEPWVGPLLAAAEKMSALLADRALRAEG